MSCFRPWTAVARHTEITAIRARRKPAVKLKELDHPTLERAFNLDTNIVITRQRISGAQIFPDVDVTPDVLKRNGRTSVQLYADVDVTLVTRWRRCKAGLGGVEEQLPHCKKEKSLPSRNASCRTLDNASPCLP